MEPTPYSSRRKPYYGWVIVLLSLISMGFWSLLLFPSFTAFGVYVIWSAAPRKVRHIKSPS